MGALRFHGIHSDMPVYPGDTISVGREIFSDFTFALKSLKRN